MVQFNFARREVSCKLVYYGPGMSGKTTNIEMIHQQAPDTMKGQLTSIATEGDRTLFFDFLPLDLGEIAGMRTKFQLYTVPGQVYYDSTRKLVLQGADGIAFVADSNPDKRQENIDSFSNLEENLRANGFELKSIPHVIQHNKRDLPGAMDVEAMNADFNRYGAPFNEAVAFKGDGVMNTLKLLAKLVLDRLNEEFAQGRVGARPGVGIAAAAPAPTPAAASPTPSKPATEIALTPVSASTPAAKPSPPPPPPPPPPSPPPPAAALAPQPAPPPPKPAPPAPPPPAAKPAIPPSFVKGSSGPKKGSGCKKAAALLIGAGLAALSALALLVAILR